MVMHHYQFGRPMSVGLDAGLHQALPPIPLLFIVFYFVRQIPYDEENKAKFFAAHVALACLYGAFNELLYFGFQAVTDGISHVVQIFLHALQNWLFASLFDAFTDYILVASIGYLFLYIDRLKSQSEIEKSLRRELKIAQLDALKSQLNPHFLFNSLHNIHALIKADPPNAREIVLLLSDYLRKVLQLQNHHFITIEEELAQVERYLKIEKIRFGDRLRVSIENALTQERYIPTLLIQPLVENAVKHSVAKSKECCNIKIRLQEANEHIEISVFNDTVAKNESDGHAIGLKNLEKRLQTNFAEDYRLTIDDKNGFRVQVAFPVIEALD